MTLLAEPEVLLKAIRGSSPRARRRAVVAAVGVVVALVVGLVVVQHLGARARLDDKEAQLAAATERLDAARADTRHAHHRTELTDYGTEVAQTEIDAAVDATTWIEAAVANTWREIASVQTRRTEVDTARLLVAAHSNEAEACFAGVADAVRANRRGDDQAAAGALGAAADHCTQTLAFATGARFPYDFADPFVLRAGNVYYGYSTNSGAGDIQVIRSTDLVSWDLVGNALAALPGWASPGATWAPAVLARGGGYVAYYTVRDAASGRQCISRAVASSPAGPFRDDSAGPLVCQLDHGGSIDPSPFVDADGRAYLLWKSEGLGAGAAAIWSQELTADGLALTGPARVLLSADRSFERGVIEAPTMVQSGGGYHLLYAAAGWSSRTYATAYASCAGPAGPCTKPPDGRVLTSGPRMAGPGGAEVFRSADGTPWVAFHAFAEPNVGYPSSRYLHIARLRVVDGRVVIDATT